MEGCDILDVAATQPASGGPATEPAATATAAAKPAEDPPAAAATAGPSGLLPLNTQEVPVPERSVCTGTRTQAFKPLACSPGLPHWQGA